MNRLRKKFAELAELKQKALVGFVTAGDPDAEKSLAITTAMCRSGLDVLELGVPFSDPTADGPVIQRASARALAAGTSLADVVALAGRIRRESRVPIILFSYYSPILKYGLQAFYEDAVRAGADGLLVPDLPFEESDEMTSLRHDENFDLIRLITPTTPSDRVADIAASATGFLYLVSMTGVTGSDGLDVAAVGRRAAALRAVTSLPVCVGFGISTPDDVAAVAAVADGVIIGSAFERMIEENIDSPDLPQMLSEMVRQYKAASTR
jgi:tryptophan synthase alpha chain